MFFCRAHWFSLPKAQRDAVWRAYRPGQTGDKRPSQEYLEVARRAIAYVAQQEGTPLPEAYRGRDG